MLSGIITAILITLFIGGTLSVYSRKRDAEFEAAAHLPLEDEV